MDSFLARLFGPVKTKSRRGRTRRPQTPTVLRVDAMEDRLAPATFTVLNTGDNGGVNPLAGAGTGTLRQAIVDANGAAGTDDITFDATAFATPQTISLAASLPTIIDALNVNGLPTSRVTVSGAGQFQVFNLFGANFSASNLTVNGGRTTTGGPALRAAFGGNITLSTVVFSGNVSTGTGGAVFIGGGGTLNVSNSTFSGNSATTTGGAIHFESGGTLNMSGSTVSGNQTTASTNDTGGAGIRLDGIGNLTIVNSTFHGNATASSGGAILLTNFGGTLDIRHSTITANTANNTAGGQGGGGIARLSGAGSVIVFSSVVSTNNNSVAPDIALVGGEVTANFSALGSSTGFTLSAASGNNLGFGAALNLGNLQNNGGVTATRLPAANSPLINSGPGNTGAVVLDQRGTSFVRLFGAGADIGAVETQTSTILSITTTEPDPTNAFSITYTVTFNQPTPLITRDNFATVGVNMASSFVNNPTVVNPANPTVWTIVVSSITANAPFGTLGLNLINSTGTIPTPILIPTPPGSPTVPASPTNPFVGPVRTIDQTAPTVVGITRAGMSPATGPVVFTVQFDEAVSGVTAGNFTIVRTGTVAGGTIAVTPSPVATATWTVTVSGYTGNGTLGLDFTNVAGVVDRATNPLAGTGIPLVGEVYAVGQPIVLSIVPSAVATNQPTVTYTITFSQDVTGLSAANLGLTVTGLNAPAPSIGTISAVGGAPSDIWTVEVNTGAPEGTITLRVTNDSGVTNPTTSALLAGPFPYVGGLVDVDRTDPQIVSITRETPPGQNTNAAVVPFLVTFDDLVDGLTLAEFNPVVFGLSGVSLDSVAPVGTAPAAQWRVLVNTGSGVGSVGLDMIAAGAVTDDAGNPLSIVGIPFTGEVYNVDRVQPAVVAIVRESPVLSGSTSDTNLNSVDFLVTFDEDVVNGTAADFGLITTGTTTGAGVTAVTPVPGNPNQVRVTVATGDTEGTIQLQYTGAGTLTDLVQNDVSNPGFAQELFTVDTVEPVVASIVRVTPEATNLTQVQFTVTFSEAVAGLTAANFDLFTTGTVANETIVSVAPIGGSPSTDWLVTVGTGTGDGVLRLDVLDSTGLSDLFTNAVTPLPFTAGEGYIVDTTAPTIVSIVLASPNPTNQSGVSYTVTFSEPVLNVATANFVLATTGAITGASIVSVTGGGAVWAVGVQTGSGSGSVRLDLNTPAGITDVATNGLTDTETGPTFDIDKAGPSIASIARSLPNTPATNATAVTYRVTFTEAVLGVSAANFALTATGVVGAAITGVAQVGSVAYDVTVTTGTGDGTVRLDLTTPLGITDEAGNPLNVTRQGDVYTVDKTAPTVTITRTVTQTSPTSNEPVQFTVVFSEPVFGLNGNGFGLGGSASPTSVVVTGTANSYIVSVSGMTTSGSVIASVLAGAAADAAGNPNLGSGTASVDFLQAVRTTADVYNTAAGKALVVSALSGVLANDSSPSGALTATLAQGPPATAGSLAFLPSGGFTFTPAVGFSGPTSFTYRASDGTTTSQPQTVTINVLSQVVRLSAAAGQGGGPQVVVYDVSGALIKRFFAYDPSFTGGVQVATGDVNDDGVDDIVVGTGIGGAPHVKVFDGRTFAEVASFFAYEDSFRGGVQVAVGDTNGDGRAELVVGTGDGGGPRVRVLTGVGFTPIADFLAFELSFRGGVNVAVGDVDGDGRGEVLTSPGFGGGPVVKVFDPFTRLVKTSFFAFDPAARNGVSITVGDVFADGSLDIITGPGSGSTVRTFRATDGLQTAEIPDAFPEANGGVRVGGKDTNNDDVNDQLLIATGKGDPARVYRFNLNTMARVDELFGFPTDFTGGIYVG